MITFIVSIIIVLLVFSLIVTDGSRNTKEVIRDFLLMTLMFTIIRFIAYLVFGVYLWRDYIMQVYYL